MHPQVGSNRGTQERAHPEAISFRPPGTGSDSSSPGARAESSMVILVTGGAGYIGSHAVLRLLRDGHHVVVVDDLSRGNMGAIDAIRRADDGLAPRLAFHHGRIGDRPLVEGVLRAHRCQAVMHFAANAYVGESVEDPLRYYRNNVAEAVALIESCHAAGVRRFVFSSTTATYGEPGPKDVPIKETLEQRPINPYGASKLMLERVIRDYTASPGARARGFAAAFLRYFNVAGCDAGGVLGEDHRPETHLIPIALQCVLGRRPEQQDTLTIFGEDYATPDGTCVRDYVHVDDLIDAHALVLGALRDGEVRAYNVGIGRGHSVREVVASVQRVSGRTPKVRVGPRRAGDPATLFADSSLIQRELAWKPRFTSLDEIVATVWRWFEAHPNGYA